MVSKRPELPQNILELFSNLPKRGAPTGTVYAPLVTEPLDGFPYRRQEVFQGFHFLGTVDRAHVDYLAEVVSKEVGERYSVPTVQFLCEKVFVDPTTTQDPILKEITLWNCLAHAREVRRKNKIFPDPSVRFVDGEYRLSGKSREARVVENDAAGTLISPELLRRIGERVISRGEIWSDPASFRVTSGNRPGDIYVDASGLDSYTNNTIALLMRTDEVQEGSLE